jgi:hypothetical protein
VLPFVAGASPVPTPRVVLRPCPQRRRATLAAGDRGWFTPAMPTCSPATLPVEVVGVRALRHDDGLPVRAASAIVAFESGWLIVSDDATHAAVWTPDGVERVRVLAPVDGIDLFDAASGTKRRKPDLEAACRVEVDGRPAALLLGSGSLPARMRGVLLEEGSRRRRDADLTALHERVAAALDLPVSHLNLEGACAVGGALRWFQRGNAHLGVPSARVDVELAALLAAIGGGIGAAEVPVRDARPLVLGGGGLAVTDALALPDGRILLSAAAEDTANAVDDGAVVDAALVLLDGDAVVAVGRLPDGPDGPEKVEGIALAAPAGHGAIDLVAVVDADDARVASRALHLRCPLP